MSEHTHPMIPVPQALRTVLTETASMMNHNLVATEIVPIVVPSDNFDGNSTKATTATANNTSSTITPVGYGSYPSPLTGRIAAKTIRASEKGYPHFNASVMDGYAIDIDAVMTAIAEEEKEEAEEGNNSIPTNTPLKFKVIERVHAGPASEVSLDHGSGDGIGSEQNINISDLKAVYITTGAAVPSCFNCIIPVEQVDETYIAVKYIRIDRSILEKSRTKQWIRPVGCDIKPNTTILSKGQAIETVHLGLLTQLGIQDVEVNCMPKVGILSTGNELVPNYEMHDVNGSIGAGADANAGIIPDANGPVLCSLLSSYGSCQPYHLGIARDDDENRLTAILRESIKQNDVVITTGGISMGEMDIVEHVLVNNLGCKVHFGRLHMKPGKPTTFLTCEAGSEDGKKGDITLIFALPGNPVSAMVCSELLVRPCLDMIHQGMLDDVAAMVQNATVHAEVHATLMNSVRLDLERPEYHRVTLNFEVDTETDENGNSHSLRINATSTGVQRSSRLMSMCEANGLMMLPQGTSVKSMTEIGETYPVLLIRRPYGNTGMFSGVKVENSSHLGNNAMMAVGIIEIIGSNYVPPAQDHNPIHYGDDDDDEPDLSERLLDIFGENETIVIQTKQTRDISTLQDDLRGMGGCLDIIFVIGTDMSFVENLQVADQIRPMLIKKNNAIVSSILEGAVRSEPLAPLFEPLMGLSNLGCLLLTVPNNGLEDAIYNVKDLIKQALSKCHS